MKHVCLGLVRHYFGDLIRATGLVCMAGGVALNVKLNQKIVALPGVKELFIQPAAGDAGTALGAATWVAMEGGDAVEPMRHAYLGPAYTNDECIAACAAHPGRPRWEKVADAPAKGAQLLAQGHPLAWFQGRMEFGPRALGNRSILGDPSAPGIADTINAQIKYRERWRPFCPSSARHGRPADARLRSSGAVHDLHLPGGAGMEGARAPALIEARPTEALGQAAPRPRRGGLRNDLLKRLLGVAGLPLDRALDEVLPRMRTLYAAR